MTNKPVEAGRKVLHDPDPGESIPDRVLDAGGSSQGFPPTWPSTGSVPMQTRMPLWDGGE
ncbi:MAG: hypothetical protein JRN54_10170 [Nitrososphaerota archaeon]|nr:hypothetical protein [Nitrososphaerota archaeon]